MTRKYAAGMWIFGQIIDRYATDGYGDQISVIEIIRMAKSSGVIGLDLNYPFPGTDVTTKDVENALVDSDLLAVSVTPCIYTREFARGSFTNPDPVVRRAAFDLAEKSVDVAHTLGARYVKFWPGQDGYDYPFQCDYRELARLAVDGIAAIARNHPKVQFAIEYKLKEPRNRLFWSSAPRTVLALERAGVDNVGVVLDFGHSLFAKENPAEMLHLVASAGRLVDIELCDNYGEWDDDLVPASIHPLETLEFLLAMRELNWQQPVKLDLFPYREDPVEAVRSSIATLELFEARLDRLDLDALRQALSRHDPLGGQRAILAALVS